MRRGIGVGAIKKKQNEQKAFESLGKELNETDLSHVQDLLVQFKGSLEEFAKKYKQDINKDPAFRAEFQKMCMKIGVDPLASNKGFWATVLGVGDFYYELGVQIIEICMISRQNNGGLISLSELLTKLRSKGNRETISEDDVKASISKLGILGQGIRLLTYGNQTLVVSVPCELSSDHTIILQLADERCSFTVSQIRKEVNWGDDRISRVINIMKAEGMVWIDEQDGSETRLWFPSLWQERQLDLCVSDLK